MIVRPGASGRSRSVRSIVPFVVVCSGSTRVVGPRAVRGPASTSPNDSITYPPTNPAPAKRASVGLIAAPRLSVR
ncbi:MAG: hypothetical protein DMD74_03445 [Gemmatimonadetes bacterium]|nr:MAG: hypothetical protein DMD74_03445 [Gemmatimonadota bacterium]